jgi:type I restriction enzyme S subunit
LIIIRPNTLLSKEFMYRYLVSQTGKSQIFRFDNGSAQPNLSANNVKLYVYPLPPLTEQHRIVAKIDELMVLCDQLKSRITDARQLQQKLADVLVEQAVA